MAHARTDELSQPVPIMTVHYLAARWLLYTACFGSVLPWGFLSPIFGFGWVLAQEVLAKDFFSDNVRKEVLAIAPLVVALVRNSLFAPLALAFIGLIIGVYRGTRRFLGAALFVGGEDGSVRCRVLGSELSVGFADATKSVFGWVGSMASFNLRDGAIGKTVVRGTKSEQTSLQTLAGGLASLWLTLALSAPSVYSAWWAADGGGFSIVSFVASTLLIVLLWLAVTLENEYEKMLRCYEEYRIAPWIAQGSCLFVAVALVWWASTAQDAVSIAYTHTLDALLALHLKWPELLPSLADVIAILEDPFSALNTGNERAIEAASSIQFDPLLFIQGAEALATVNFALAVLKVLATYGREAFAVVDTLRQFLVGGKGLCLVSSVVQVQECVAPPERAEVDAFLVKMGVSREELAMMQEVDWSNRALDDADMAAVGVLLSDGSISQLLTLSLTGNTIGDASAFEIAEALKFNASVTDLRCARFLTKPS